MGEREIFRGWSDDVDDDLANTEIDTINVVDKRSPILTFNI